MPKPFNPDAERNHFALPLQTRQQIQALILDLNLDARNVIIRAVAELWQREIGEPERDILAELDEIRGRLTKAGF
jgi:hypothetical protein